MDLWVVAAAAGAGYLAKFCQNISQGREGSSGFPSGSSVPDNSKSPTLIQKIGDNRNGNHSDQTYAETSGGDGPMPTNATGNIAFEHEKEKDSGMLCSSDFPPELYEKLEYRRGCTIESDVGEIPECFTWEVRDSHDSDRGKSSLRSKHLHLQFSKPRCSLDSCLMAQMSGEAEIEDYLLSPLVSPCTPTVRPFLITDGRRIISRSSGYCRNGPHKEVRSKANDNVVGVPSLLKSRGADYSKLKFHKGKNQMGKSSFTSTSGQFHSQVSASGQVFFCFGISIGIIFTVIANKLEVKTLKQSLKQTENLVQDLQEELEMKDSLTVKELVNDDDSQDTHENWCGNKELDMFSRRLDTTVVIKCDDDQSVNLKEDKSISKIEAELEEELERLEESMKGSALRGRLPDDIEFDDEFDEDTMAQLVHGELNANIVRQSSSSESSPDRGSSSPSTPLSAKHGVSPYELTLRLHEVIQSRLEKQIKELEAEIAKSQKRIQHLESERFISWRDISTSESSSTLGSPIAIEAHIPEAQTLVMNLSGDALNAYNETYEELDKRKVSQSGSSKIRVENQHCNQQSTNQNVSQDCSMSWGAFEGETLLSNGRDRMPSDEGTPYCYEDEDEDGDDGDDLLLIKQIVEKARQGSPAVLKAQRALVYLNKDED